MGRKAAEALELDFDGLIDYLRANHSVYMQTGTTTYYLTDVNDQYWRVQSTDKLNDKGHFVDASELVPTVAEFVDLPFEGGKTIRGLFDEATFFASVK